MGAMGGSGPDLDPSERKSTWWVLGMMILLVLVGTANFVVFKLMYSSYGEDNNFFVNQGVNLLFVVYGGAIVYPRMCMKIGVPEKPFPQRKFLIMGVLDAFGTFFTAMGAVGTPGQYQSLLNQTLIPLTMICSAILLRTRYNWRTVAGAALILAGAAVSVVPSILEPHHLANGTAWNGSGSNNNKTATGGGSTTRLGYWAYLIYFASNIPMAMSAVYKEIGALACVAEGRVV